MPKYENAVIYKLCCKDASITDEYIGSTCNKYKRKQNHKFNCNNENRRHYNLPVYQFIRANGNFENWDMIILEEYPCESKVQLEMKEREWIEERKPTLNKNIPTRTKQEWREENREKNREKGRQYYYENIEDYKQYREEYKEEIKEYQDIYREEHKEEIREQKKQYREENKDEIKERKKQYYQEHKEEISEKYKIKCVCECGAEVSKGCLSRHRKSQRHLKYLEELNL